MATEVTKPREIGDALHDVECGYGNLGVSLAGMSLKTRLRKDRLVFEAMLEAIAEIDAMDPELLKPDRIRKIANQMLNYMHTDLGLNEDDMIDVIMGMTLWAADMMTPDLKLDPGEQYARFCRAVLAKKKA